MSDGTKVDGTAPEILALDGPLVVARKSAGLRSTPERAGDLANLEARIAATLGRRVWAVHQLDRDTSGLLLLVDAKNEVERWRKRLAAGSKTYLALCHGALDTHPRTGVRVEVALAKRPDGHVIADPAGKPATTQVRVVARADRPDGATCVALCRPRTGRTHQVRVHLAHLGIPVIGDPRYAGARVHTEEPLPSRQMLHLWQIKLAGRVYCAELPDDLVALAARLGLALPASPT